MGMSQLLKVVCCLFIGVLFFAGCRSSKIKTYDGPAPERTQSEVLSLINKNSINYNFYTAKIGGDVDTDDFAVSVSIGLFLQRDKYIFSTFKKFSTEVARSYITNDSIYIVNRFLRYYQAEKLRSIWNMINLQMPLWQMQDLIVGNQIVPFEDDILTFGREGNDYKLAFLYDNNEAFYTIDGYTGLVKEVKMVSQNYGEVTAIYDDFRNTNGVKRPYKNTLIVKSPDINATVVLNIKEIVWNKDSNIHFTIPTRYERVRL
jgi:Domain of unknown function (DUF4292)